MPRQPRHTLAARMLSRLDALAACTEVAGDITRRYLAAEHRAAADLVMSWMRDAGMTVSLDAGGAVRGRIPGATNGARTLVIGSPLDTLPRAGRFEGALGLVLPLEVISELRRLGQTSHCAIELVAFGMDAAHRYPPGTAGIFVSTREDTAERALAAVDSDGVSLRDALVAFGCDVSAFGEPAYEPADILGYLEIHPDRFGAIEKAAAPIGIVTTIQGATRNDCVIGSSGRGASQSASRRDIMGTVAEMIIAMEPTLKAHPAAAVTIGRIGLSPGTPGLPPVEAAITLDITSAVDRERRRVALDLDRDFRSIARRRQVSLAATEIFNRSAVVCDPRFIASLTKAAEDLGHPALAVPGGLAHASLPLNAQCPIGMILVRSLSGDGIVVTEDLEIAARHLMSYIGALPAGGRSLP